jgi:hypothetical protein
VTASTPVSRRKVLTRSLIRHTLTTARRWQPVYAEFRKAGVGEMIQALNFVILALVMGCIAATIAAAFL